ncbi:hypothetical protein [Bradyrhizobium sp. CCBAU 53380]|uniref:hypothetical protein n=1 Tax=Bradyrhizobium sp. CCBAU 53380 TaxID=1325117 RepID=UPI002303AE82|nr:hypothetical protein [Bradyrhizobium sp. CCBAU 53380]MDA9420991.1 hypothetical protein [Bradyrhizobium sp. CCBAU 53380]
MPVPRSVSNLILAAGSVLAIVLNPTISRSDEVDECLGREQKAYETPQAFEQRGEITCGSADVVGIPPRVRTHDASSVVSYKAPPGFAIRNQAITSIQIENISQSNGSYGSPTISPDGSTVTVPIACTGKGIGQGRAWQEIVVRGTIVRVASTEQIKQWAVQCVKCVSRQDCPR